MTTCESDQNYKSCLSVKAQVLSKYGTRIQQVT